jgi:hypothetical protein
MGREVRRLFETTDLRERKIFIMGGHPEGFVTFGANLSEAFATLAARL